MQDIISSWFVQGMIKATGDMWLKGWDERNGGNISLRLLPEDVSAYAGSFHREPRREKLTWSSPSLADTWFIVTGSGKFFRNVPLDPEDTLALIKVDGDGAGYHIMWGLGNGGLPTSELASHLQSHAVRMQVSDNTDRVIMHCHATNLIALSYVVELDSAVFTRELWEGSTECLVVFPDGIGIVPWMVPGTDAIGDATSETMKRHSLVLWPFHGIFGAGPSLDETFGLIDTAEKAAEIMVKVRSMGGRRQTITRAELIALGERFGVKPIQEPLNI